MWLPYQVGLEYQRRWLSVASDVENEYNNLIKELDALRQRLPSKFKFLRDGPDGNSSNINFSGLVEEISRIVRDLQKEKNEYIKHTKVGNVVHTRLTHLYDGKVGEPYSFEKLVEIFEIGEQRYKFSYPPGYEDTDKTNDRRYGDLIL